MIPKKAAAAKARRLDRDQSWYRGALVRRRTSTQPKGKKR